MPQRPLHVAAIGLSDGMPDCLPIHGSVIIYGVVVVGVLLIFSFGGITQKCRCWPIKTLIFFGFFLHKNIRELSAFHQNHEILKFIKEKSYSKKKEMFCEVTYQFMAYN